VSDDKFRIGIHESGHVAAGLALDGRIVFAQLGLVRVKFDATELRPVVRLTFLMSGEAAELYVLGDADLAGSREDIATATTILRGLNGTNDPERESEQLKYVRAAPLRLIKHRDKRELRRIADALIACDCLTGIQITALLDQ
jgi:hypothetical protein